MHVDVHVDALPYTGKGNQFTDVFLAFGKTVDWTNWSVGFEFDHGWSNTGNNWDMGDDVTSNGASVKPSLFFERDLVSPNAALRMDYSAANKTITYLFDANGATAGYTWVPKGTASLASGRFDLHLSPTDTFTIFLLGSSSNQVVAAGQAYLDNLVIVVDQSVGVGIGGASVLDPTAVALAGSVNPNGLATTAWFEYGLTTNYGSTSSVVLSPTNGTAPQTVSATLCGLQPGNTYHFRLAAINDGGSATSGDGVFTLPSLPYSYETNNGTITITKYHDWGAGSDQVDIPSSITCLPVTSIGGSAFRAWPGLTRVTIPDTVTSIGDYAFYYCRGLTNVLIPDSVTNIGGNAFAECGGLNSVTIGNGVTSLGNLEFLACTNLLEVNIGRGITNVGSGAFSGCTRLMAMTVDPENSTYSSVDGALFNKSQTTLVLYPPGRYGSYVIPSGVTSVGSDAFRSCTGLTGVTLPGGLSDIGDRAFYYCSSLSGVSLPNAVTHIGREAFLACTRLTSVAIPDNTASVGDYAFEFCSGLTNIVVGSGLSSIGNYVFEYCSKVASLTLNNGLTGIGTGMFKSCSGLRSLIVPTSVTNIGMNAFSGCSSLASVVLPISVNRIGAGAFSYCSGLDSVTIPNGVITIGDSAFSSCSSLTNITFGSRLASIGNYALQDCGNLRSAYFSGDAPSPGMYIFSGATDGVVYYLPGTEGWDSTYGGLPTALWQLPNPLVLNTSGSFGLQPDGFGFRISWATNIPVVVEACTNLANHSWSPAGTNILTNGWSYFLDPAWTNYRARFYRVRTPVTVPLTFDFMTNGGAITISRYIGSGGSVVIPATINGLPVTSIGDYAFAECRSITEVEIPNSITNIGSAAFSRCSGLTSVVIPDGVVSIGDEAFEHCTNLSCVTIPASVSRIGSHQAFSDCPSLIQILVDPASAFYSTETGVLFNKDKTTLIQYPGGRAGSYVIPASVRSLGEWAFENCTSLTSVTIPLSLTNLTGFYGCTNLTSINVQMGNPLFSSLDGVLFNPNQTTLIEYPQGKVGTYTIPAGVTSISEAAMAGCNGLTAIYVDPQNTAFSSLDGVLFSADGTLLVQYPPGRPQGGYSIPSSVSSVGIGAFYGCSSLTNVTIGNNVRSIGDGAFERCTGLTSLAMGNGVTSIGESAFEDCTGLTNVTLGNSLSSIRDNVFEGCTSLISVTIPSTVVSVGQDAFNGCINLAGAYFQGNAPVEGGYIFPGNNTVTVHYLPGTLGWGITYGGRPTALWVLPSPLILTASPGFGVPANGFGFVISWATNVPVVVEACTNLANYSWSPLGTNTLTNGWSYFSDPQWTNYSARFYRLRSAS